MNQIGFRRKQLLDKLNSSDVIFMTKYASCIVSNMKFKLNFKQKEINGIVF